MSQRHGGHLLAERLVAHGVTTVFTLCGNHTLTIYEGLSDNGIELIDLRTEASVVMAADAYARAGRRLGVALVTGGPAHTNALTGLITAHSSDSPVLLLSGQADLALSGKGAQQEIDQVAVAAPLCKFAAMVDRVDRIPELVDTAILQALSGTTGATHLSLPSDVMGESAEGIDGHGAVASPDSGTVDTDAVAQVISLLADARRPVLIAGAGAYMAGAADALTRLLDAAPLPLFTLDSARGIVPDAHPCSLGYADASLNRAAARIADADVVVLVGRRLDFRLRFGSPDAIGADATLIDVRSPGATTDENRPRQYVVETDVARFVDGLATAAEGREWDGRWLDDLTRIAPMPDPPASSAAAPHHPHAVALALREAIGDDTTLVFDGGDFVQWCRGAMAALGPGQWIRLGPMSTCGAGTPFAIGARRAHPDRPVVLVTGDGSFGYYLIEFEAALRQHLPFVAIVGHNQSWGLERNLQRGLFGDEYLLASDLSPTRFDQVVTALGGHGRRIEDLGDLPGALADAIASGLPSCIEIPVTLDPSPLTEAVIARGGVV